jgi:segregation and condensation protein B
MSQFKFADTILAMLFASEEPLSLKRIASVLDDATVADIKQSIAALQETFAPDVSSIVLEQVAGGFQLVTNPRYAEYVARLYSGKRKHRLSKAAMETLAIVVYKQPITRSEIEMVRGVGCGGVLNTLMERTLIKIEGKAKVLGAPFLYGTTAEFLEYLGLNSLKDLPSIEELGALLEQEESMRNAEEGGAGDVDAPQEQPQDGNGPLREPPTLPSEYLPGDPGPHTRLDEGAAESEMGPLPTDEEDR